MSEEGKSKNVSRRSLVKRAAMGTAGVATAGLLTGFKSKESRATAPPAWPADLPAKWDRTVEMLVLGVGIAGACAAVEAHDLGVKVLAIEKSAQIRGTCSISGGALCGAGSRHQKKNGIYDDVEVMIKDILRCGDELGDPEVIRAFAELSGNTIDWLEDLGCKLMPGVRPWPEMHTINRSHNSAPEGSGLGWMLGLESAIRKRGIEVELETVVTRLYRAATGRVVGVQVKKKDGTVRNYKATKGVLISMGGIGGNMQMWEQYSPVCKDLIRKAKKARSVYPLTVVGDGYRLVNEIDAYLYPVPPSYDCIGTEVTPQGFTQSTIFPFRWADVGAICLNANGERFWNETSFSDTFVTRKWKTQPGLWQLMLFDDSVRQTPQGQTYAQPVIDKVLASGHNTVHQANSIEELAAKFGIPAEAARKTVEDWNRLIDTGGPDKLTGRDKLGAKILKAPFWGIEMILIMGNSKAGCKITPRAEVMDPRDQVIPGLYAAGEMAFFQVHGSARVHIPGGLNGTGSNYGRIAARSIAKEKAQA